MTRQEWGERVLVVGTGLIGTSVALAARAAGADVRLDEADPGRLHTAVSAGAGEPVGADRSADLVVVAVPPRAVGQVVAEHLRSDLNAIVTHVSSVQSLPEREVEAAGVKLAHFVGGHPIAGRERSGPVHASADLFRERPWVVCPSAGSAATAIGTVVAFAESCGARPVLLDATAHDALLARLSHVPQLVASALAATIVDVGAAGAAVAGTGLRDTTRLADSEAGLWAEIVTANAAAVAAGLRGVAQPLLELASALEDDTDASETVRTLLDRGRTGRALLPGKHGGAPVELRPVQVVVPDEPGALARLLAGIAEEGVNLEDLRVEHAPGQPLGVAEILVVPESQERLARALHAHGWTVVA